MLEVVRGFRVLRLAVLPMLQKRVPKITNIVPPRPVPESPHGSFPSVCGLPQKASVAALGTSLPGRRLDQPGRIADKVLYGSGWFLLQRSPAELVAEFRALPVRPAVMEWWLAGNAAKQLGAA